MTVQQIRIESLLPVSVPVEPAIGQGSPCGCAESRWRDHHDRLLRVETDLGELVELLEMAVTWGELDWSGCAVVPPHRWLDFASGHPWRDPDRMERVFSMATDVAARSSAGTGRRIDVIGA